jgi:hypothetical protein
LSLICQDIDVVVKVEGTAYVWPPPQINVVDALREEAVSENVAGNS